MKSIAIICCYFGKLRSDYKTWLLSCKYNNTIEWIIFTDCDWGKVPKNIKIINISFNDFKEYVQKTFEFKICLERPYKICDYKPAFGYIFKEYLQEYDFWGYCDFDMIFGNIRKFITNDILENYEKIVDKNSKKQKDILVCTRMIQELIVCLKVIKAKCIIKMFLLLILLKYLMKKKVYMKFS